MAALATRRRLPECASSLLNLHPLNSIVRRWKHRAAARPSVAPAAQPNSLHRHAARARRDGARNSGAAVPKLRGPEQAGDDVHQLQRHHDGDGPAGRVRDRGVRHRGRHEVHPPAGQHRGHRAGLRRGRYDTEPGPEGGQGRAPQRDDPAQPAEVAGAGSGVGHRHPGEGGGAQPEDVVRAHRAGDREAAQCRRGGLPEGQIPAARRGGGVRAHRPGHQERGHEHAGCSAGVHGPAVDAAVSCWLGFSISDSDAAIRVGLRDGIIIVNFMTTTTLK
ncbi:hypothetical protein THAOC_26376 [Thalassiosira oceanica]|uniref:Uncharacterized protein n=1 Tax=Thalassiosira oceanica TaxID=159749 RepID=K0S596_THAOC|nr:hypothetical protein THAOC_26376 [Thalassiosira oceanica]|eukprot:EJK54072.1 hypothetical protein THAOC_26376 [Thalassiosira oceanica]